MGLQKPSLRCQDVSSLIQGLVAVVDRLNEVHKPFIVATLVERYISLLKRVLIAPIENLPSILNYIEGARRLQRLLFSLFVNRVFLTAENFTSICIYLNHLCAPYLLELSPQLA